MANYQDCQGKLEPYFVIDCLALDFFYNTINSFLTQPKRLYLFHLVTITEWVTERSIAFELNSELIHLACGKYDTSIHVYFRRNFTVIEKAE